MTIVQPLPFTETPCSPPVLPRPFPSQTVDVKDRLCWVHRESKTSHQPYLWPAVYYANWTEACHELSRVFTPEENRKLCLQLYSRVTIVDTTVVAKLILTSGEMEFVEIQADSDAVFGQFFGGYFAQAMQVGSNASSFLGEDKAWYQDFRQAVDQAVRLSNGDSTTVPQTLVDELPRVATPAAAATPSTSLTQEKDSPTTSSDPSPVTTISPASTSSQQETPTRSNTTSRRTAEQRPKRNALFSSSRPKDPAPSSRASSSQTPADPRSSRPRRPRPVLHGGGDDDDDDFYQFRPLITFLTKKLKWQYRPARNNCHAWAYLPPGSVGEKFGKVKEDFFYEEGDVVEYCKAHNYKQKYKHLLIDNDDDNTSFITPSPHKRQRSTKA